MGDEDPRTEPVRLTGSTRPPGGRRRRVLRRVAVGVAVVGQVVLAGGIAAHYITAGRTESELTAAASAAPPPPSSWAGSIHDVGPGGLHLRTEPVVMPDTSARVVPAEHPLRIVCGVGGDAVSGLGKRTNIWLRTDDDHYVSALYVTVPGRTHLPGCPLPDVPLVPIGPPPPVAPPVPGAPGAPAGPGTDPAAPGPAPVGGGAAPGPVPGAPAGPGALSARPPGGGGGGVPPIAPFSVGEVPAEEREHKHEQNDEAGPDEHGLDDPEPGSSPPDPGLPVG